MNYFELEKQKTSIKKELFAGISTFLTMSYVLILIPLVLSQAGVNFGAALFATAITSFLSCLMMGLVGNYPFAIAPGLGLNAVFAYSAVLNKGYTWQEALGCVFVTGFIMLILNLLGVRRRVMHEIPLPLQCAVTAGIGLFLTFIGMKNIGLIEADSQMLVQFGGISLKSTLAGLGVIGVAAAIYRGYTSSLFFSILIVWLFSLLFGLSKWEGIISWPSDPRPTFFQLDLSVFWRPERWDLIFSMVFIMLFDSTGSIIALAQQGGFFTKDGQLPRSKRAFIPDSIGSMLAGLLGTSNTTIFLESLTGILSGGRTGIATITTGFCFLIALFFTPLARSIPLFATAPVHIVIGCMMLAHIAKIQWDDATDYIPASLVLMTIPFTFSIVDGVAIGLITFPVIKLLSGKKEQTGPIIWIVWFLLIIRYFYI